MISMTTTPPPLPPEHVDTPQQKRTLRSNKTAAWVRKTFPRGTRVEATRAFDEPGNGRFGTVVSHVPGQSNDGGRLTVLWDEPSPFRSGPNVTRGIWPGGVLVVDPVTGKGIVRDSVAEHMRKQARR